MAGVRGKAHSEMLLDFGKHNLMNSLRVAGRVNQGAADGVRGGDIPEPLTQSFVEGAVEALEPVGGRARGGAGETEIDRDIEHQCQIRLEIAECDPMEGPELVERNSFAIPLVGDRRVRKTVG
jgi:hypothetical protein